MYAFDRSKRNHDDALLMIGEELTHSDGAIVQGGFITAMLRHINGASPDLQNKW